jgi:hypothetical protein
MILKGKSHVLGNDVNTDYIIAAKYRSLGLDFKEMAKHLLEDLDPNISAESRKAISLLPEETLDAGPRENSPEGHSRAGVSAVLALLRKNSTATFNVGLWFWNVRRRRSHTGTKSSLTWVMGRKT